MTVGCAALSNPITKFTLMENRKILLDYFHRPGSLSQSILTFIIDFVSTLKSIPVSLNSIF